MFFVDSVQFSRSVLSDSLRPQEPQHARPPCPSPTYRSLLNSNSKACLLSQWCHPTISSSVIPFSSCLQSFPASGSFPMSQFVSSGSQSIGVSASASVLPMHIQGWFPLGLFGLISLQSQGPLRVFRLQHNNLKTSVLRSSAFFIVQLSHLYMTTGKTISLTRWTFVGKVMSLHLNMLSRLVIAFLPRCKQNTSCQMPGWMKHRLESRFQGEISITSDMQMKAPLWQKVERNWRASWWKWKRIVKQLA